MDSEVEHLAEAGADAVRGLTEIEGGVRLLRRVYHERAVFEHANVRRRDDRLEFDRRLFEACVSQRDTHTHIYDRATSTGRTAIALGKCKNNRRRESKNSCCDSGNELLRNVVVVLRTQRFLLFRSKSLSKQSDAWWVVRERRFYATILTLGLGPSDGRRRHAIRLAIDDCGAAFQHTCVARLDQPFRRH